MAGAVNDARRLLFDGFREPTGAWFSLGLTVLLVKEMIVPYSSTGVINVHRNQVNS